MNMYAYVGGDPVNGTDPNGTDTIKVQFVDQKINIPKHLGGGVFPQWVSGGHSGIVLVRSDGYTNYREYGRYPGGRGASPGTVRRPEVTNLSYVDGVPTTKSLTTLFEEILAIGEMEGSSKIKLSFNLNNDDFKDMAETVERWEDEVVYSVGRNNTCHGFCEAVEWAGRKDGDLAQLGGKFTRRLTPENIEETVESVRKRYEKHVDRD
jgi:hypothetical protein